MDFWNKLTARQKQNKRERFEYVMKAVNSITPGEVSGKDYDEEIDSLKSRLSVLEGASDLNDLISRIEALEEIIGPLGESEPMVEDETEL
jgi:hypothetical protein